MTKARKEYTCEACELKIVKGENWEWIAVDDGDIRERKNGKRFVLPGRPFFRLHTECIDMLCDGDECQVPEEIGELISDVYGFNTKDKPLRELLLTEPIDTYPEFDTFRNAYLKRLKRDMTVKAWNDSAERVEEYLKAHNNEKTEMEK